MREPTECQQQGESSLHQDREPEPVSVSMEPVRDPVVEDQDLLNTAYASKGYPETVVKIMSAARGSSSDRQYKVFYAKFQKYCKDKSLDPLQISLAEGLGFLTSLHEAGLSYVAR